MLFPLVVEPNELIVNVLICFSPRFSFENPLSNLGEGVRTTVRIRELNTLPLTSATFFRTGV